MYTVREVLAAVLVLAIGVGMILRPAAVLRLQFFAHGPTTGHRGEYGSDPDYEAWKLLAVRAVGVVAVGLGVAILALPHV